MNVKKGLGIGVLSSAVFLSGCSFPWESEKGVVSPEVASSQAQENPEKLFFDFATASGKKGLENLGLDTFDREILKKGKGEITMTGDFNMEGVPIVGGGTGTFSTKIQEEADFSDTKNPLLSEKVSVMVDALGGLVKLDTQGELRIVNNSVFVGISKLDTNFPGLTSEINAIIEKFVGVWYGNSFQEISTILGEESLDIQKILTGGTAPTLQSLDLIEDIAKNPSAYITFNSFVKEEGGYYFFEVTPKKEAYKKVGEIVKVFIENSGLNTAFMYSDFDKEMKDFVEKASKESVMLAYTPENPEYFKISKVVDVDGTKVVAENTKDGINVSIQKTTGEDAGEIAFTKNSKGDFSLVVDIPTEFKGARTELLSGKCTEDIFTLAVTGTIFDRELGEKVLKNILNVSLKKSNNVWGGEITTPEFKEGKLLVSNAAFSMNDSKVTLSAVYNEKVITNVTVTTTAEKTDSVDIKVPENIKPFTDIESDIEKEMNALYGLDDNELQAEDSQAIAEIVEADANTQEQVVPTPAQTVPDQDMNDTEDNAQGGADYSAIIPKLARMAELMNENPTGDAEIEFNALKAEVDAYAAENDINTETLKELLMKEIVNQSNNKE